MSCFLHVILSFPTSAATAVATTAYRLLSLRVFFLLSVFSTSLLYLSSATTADGLRTPGAPLGGFPVFPTYTPGTSRYRGDFCFVLLCTHRAPGSILSRLFCSLSEGIFNCILVPSPLGPLEFGTLPINDALCRRFRSLLERLRAQLPKSPPQQPAVDFFCVDPTFYLSTQLLEVLRRNYQLFSNPPAHRSMFVGYLGR